MKRVSGLLLAIVLTVPVFWILTRIPAIPGWFFSERGYAALNPLFNVFGAVGVEEHENVIAGVMLLLSFIVSCVVVSLVWHAHSHLKAAR